MRKFLNSEIHMWHVLMCFCFFLKFGCPTVIFSAKVYQKHHYYLLLTNSKMCLVAMYAQRNWESQSETEKVKLGKTKFFEIDNRNLKWLWLSLSWEKIGCAAVTRPLPMMANFWSKNADVLLHFVPQMAIISRGWNSRATNFFSAQAESKQFEIPILFWRRVSEVDFDEKIRQSVKNQKISEISEIFKSKLQSPEQLGAKKDNGFEIS